MQNSITGRLEVLHQQLQIMCKPLGRIAVALYDKNTNNLYTFLASGENSPLKNYQVSLDSVPSLKELADSGEYRILNNLGELTESTSHHSQQIKKAGFQSSMTVPLMSQGKFFGILFFDSYEKNTFDSTFQDNLNIYSQLISEIISHDLSLIKTLKGAVITAREFSRLRDEETASHLSRMGHYSRLIAMELSESHHISEEEIEYIHQFAPLHDIGKMAIPDSILLKPGGLIAEELDVMRTHVMKGVEVVDLMIKEFDLDTIRHIEILRNIIVGHHERYDGSGYPAGWVADETPIEGRIIAAADVFDALTTERPYKKAWSFKKSLHYMQVVKSELFDPACVSAIVARIDDIKEIQQRFAESEF